MLIRNKFFGMSSCLSTSLSIKVSLSSFYQSHMICKYEVQINRIKDISVKVNIIKDISVKVSRIKDMSVKVNIIKDISVKVNRIKDISVLMNRTKDISFQMNRIKNISVLSYRPYLRSMLHITLTEGQQLPALITTDNYATVSKTV